jgi:hypothetical protein
MKERPILFSAPMVRAILEGRKTMTRRVVKEFPTIGYRWGGWIVESSSRKETGAATVVPESNSQYCATGKIAKRCPYGNPGDRLWVRETFSQHPQFADVAYRADGEEFKDSDGFTWIPKWKPSIFMPRALSRITIEITNVRVERLQDISEGDAKSEGVDAEFEFDLETLMNKQTVFEKLQTFFFGFKHVWKKINGPGSWDANPWVWVIEFKRVEEGK